MPPYQSTMYQRKTAQELIPILHRNICSRVLVTMGTRAHYATITKLKGILHHFWTTANIIIFNLEFHPWLSFHLKNSDFTLKSMWLTSNVDRPFVRQCVQVENKHHSSALTGPFVRESTDYCWMDSPHKEPGDIKLSPCSDVIICALTTFLYSAPLL